MKYTVNLNEIPRTATMEEIKAWLNDNIGAEGHDWFEEFDRLNGRLMYNYIYFNTEEDAMAFKLRWL